MGVARPELCVTLAEVIQSLGVQRGMVVSGRVGDAWLDELSTLGENTLAEFYQGKGFATAVISPFHFPVQPAVLADLAGGDRQANAEIIRRLLRNEELGPKRDAVLLNAAAALFVAGKTKSLTEGWELADELLTSGAAQRKLIELQSSKDEV
jgi:anthranilate phosphoribosyltransferase